MPFAALPWQRTPGDFADGICMALGSLDTEFRPAKQRHVHAESAAPWHPAPPD